jgi:TonB-linked SusC/RagA family outer membrane protein
MRLKRQKIIAILLVGCAWVVCICNDAYGQNNSLRKEVASSRADTTLFGKINSISPDQLLKGRISGVRVSDTDGNPLNAIITTIRGINSMRGNSDPLWIVDGVMLNPSQLEVEPMFWQDNYQKKDFTSVQNTLATINPDDIDKIEVLKDVAATAIYGTKGGNGVIIITTKQAKQQERKISWSSNISLATTGMGEDMLNLSDYKSFQEQLGKNVSALSNPVNWTDEALKGRAAFSHNHNLSVSGTENKMRYYVSGFYRQVEGVVERNNSTLGGLRVNIDMIASNFFSFGTRIGFAYADINMTKGANPLGELSTITAIKRGAPEKNAFNTYATWQADYDDNSKEYRVMPSIYFTLNPAKGLKLNTNFGNDFRGKDRSSWLGKGTPFGYENNGAASLSSLSALSYNVNSVLSYNKSTDGHNFMVSAGAELLSRYNSYNTMNGVDFFSHELRAKGINLASSKAQIHKFYVRNEQTGFTGTFSYDYLGKYGINGILRLDKNIKQEDKYSQYPAINGWLKIIDNDNSGDADLISTMMLRAGWGKAGNTVVTPYEFLGRYYTGPDSYKKPELSPFHKVFWKTESSEFNAGIEIGFLKERLVFNGTYYDKKTDDRIILNCFGEEYGKNGFWRYASRKTVLDRLSMLSNRGFELDLQAQIVKSKKWNWNLSINGTTNENNVVRVAASSGTGGLIGSGVYANYNQVGNPVSAFWGYRYAGIITPENIAKAPTFNGIAPKAGDFMYKDLTSNRDVNASDKEVIGNPNPRFFGGIYSSLSIDRFSFDVLIEGAYGHDILNLDRMMHENVSGTGNISTESFTKAYNFTTIPEYPSVKAAGTGEISDRYIEKGNFTRLSEIKAGYDFPMQGIVWIKSLKLNLSIYNVLSFSSGKRWNPDVNSYGFDNSRLGIVYGAYPETRFFTFGVNATF